MIASSYLKTLVDILSQTEATKENGTRLSLDDGTGQVVDHMLSLKLSGNKAMVVGNGGSAAIASHMHNDMSKSVGIRALVFNEAPLLTAYSNDISYTAAFENIVNLWADKGDILIAISSSGKSENIIRAANAALDKSCIVVTLSGFKSDNPLRQCGNMNFFVPSSEYGYVELGHSILTHYITDAATKKGRSGFPE
jgi:D-sedoheptulose 7-phosphate isomerase